MAETHHNGATSPPLHFRGILQIIDTFFSEHRVIQETAMKANHRTAKPLTLVKLSIRQRLGLFTVGTLAAMLLFAAAPSSATSGAEAPQSAEAAAPASTPADQRKREITKRIPDQKVLLDSPPITISLDGLFDETDVGRDGGALTYEVLHNKKPKVAEAALEGNNLVLTWGEPGKNEIKLRVTNQQTGKILDNKINVEVWQPDYWKLAMIVVGGLGIFLLGMKNMSEGLQAVAGAGLRRLISAVTDNRLLAVTVGTTITMLIQSSSITTVMVVGFVNSGLMSLSQAMGVVMGANIGTTITGWILVLKIGKYGLPIVGVCAFIYLFSKRDRIRYLAMAAMGLGMVFFGLELMKNGFAIVKNLPAFEAWFQTFSADTYWGVLKCASVGCVVTFIVQSSSATLGITISLAVTAVIPFETAAALVLGENIGTTITMELASIGATTNSKRAAHFHSLFNIIGVAWITAIFIPIYAPLIKSMVGVVPGPDGTEVIRNVTEGIALTHTVFNVTNTLLFLPFVRRFGALLERLVPHKADKEKPHLTSLDVRMLETSAIALEQSRVELLRMADGCVKLAGWTKEILEQEIPDQKTVQKAFHREEVLDTVQDEIVEFMAHLLSGNIPHDVAEEARCQLRMADEYESVSDYYITILKSHLKLEQSGLHFPDRNFKDLMRLHDMVADYLTLINRGYEQRQPEVITKAHSQGNAITLRAKELRDGFLAKLSDEKLDPQIIVAYSAQLNAYRRVREHVLNIAETLAGEK